MIGLCDMCAFKQSDCKGNKDLEKVHCAYYKKPDVFNAKEASERIAEAERAKTDGDLISRKEVLEMIIVAGECEPDLGYTHLHDVIEALPSAEPKTDEWIPVSERLPSAEDCPMDCMVTRRSKYVGNYTDMAVAEANGTWTHEDWKAITINGNATCISTRDADIIAWMPLPEPYKGGE